jgi:hypothetical protein
VTPLELGFFAETRYGHCSSSPDPYFYDPHLHNFKFEKIHKEKEKNGLSSGNGWSQASTTPPFRGPDWFSQDSVGNLW